MRILQVMAGNQHGGAETAYVDMCIAMHERGSYNGQPLDIQAVTRPNDIRVKRLRDAGITVHELPFGGKLDIYTRWRIGGIIKKFKPDIIQSWMSRAPWKVPGWSQKMGVPRYYHFGRLGNQYKAKYFTSCDAFAAITPELVTYIQTSFANGQHARHINNFAEVEQPFSDIKRADYGIPDDATLVLGLGRLHDDKAFDVLIKAIARLPDHVHAWIAGEGPLRAELESLITALGVQDRVKLLGWQSDRAALFQQSDICAFISRDEPFGTVFVQSWALKTPVIVSLADGPRQFVTDEIDGLKIQIDDVDALIEAIQRFEQDKNLASACVKNGFDHYQRAFTKDASVNAYLDFYQTINKQT